MASTTRISGRSSRTLYTYVLSISVTTLVVGFNLGFSSPALPDMRRRGVLTEAEASWFASLLTVGGMVGSLASSFTVDRFGRRGTLQIAGLFCMASFGLICFATVSSLLFIARLLAGVCSGLVFAAAPTYISELSTNELRGYFGSFTQLAITIGILCAFLIDAIFSAGYVVLSAVGLVSTCIAFAALLPLYDSPRWYAARRLRHVALAALTNLRGSSDVAENEVADFDDSKRSEHGSTESMIDEKSSRGDLTGSKVELISESPSRSAASGWRVEELRSSAFYRPMFVSIGLMAIQQFSGINAVLFYTADILASTHSEFAERYGGIAIAAAQVIATMVAASLMERAGRKQLLRVSLVVMAIGCFLLAASSTKSSTDADPFMAFLAVSSLLIYIIGFSIGMGPIPMIVMSEIFDTRFRAIACGVTIFSNWLLSFIVTLYFGSLAAAVGQATVYIGFGAVCLGGVVFAWQSVPETRGKTLEEIQLFFNRIK